MNEKTDKQLKRMIESSREAIGLLMPLMGIGNADKARERLGNTIYSIEDEIANPRAFPGGPTLNPPHEPGNNSDSREERQ